MNPYNNPMDPFFETGVPGDSFEDVLSLQTYSVSGDSLALIGNTGECRTTGDCSNTGSCTNTGSCHNTGTC